MRGRNFKKKMFGCGKKIESEKRLPKNKNKNSSQQSSENSLKKSREMNYFDSPIKMKGSKMTQSVRFHPEPGKSVEKSK